MVEAVLFVIFGMAAIFGAVTMVWARNPVYSAMGLMLTMFSIAVFYVSNAAEFVAVVQVIIYAGAVMTLFLFVIMLIGVDKSDAYGTQVPAQRLMTWVVAIGLFAAIALAGSAAWVTGSDIFGTPDLNGTIENVADELFGTWMVVFLSTVMLLTIAALGTIALAYFGADFEDEEATL